MPEQLHSPADSLPQNIDAERGVLGAMLLDNDIIPEVVHHLKTKDFALEGHQVIYEVLTTLYDRQKSIDLTILTDELKRRGRLEDVGGYFYLANLEQYVLSTGSGVELSRIVADKALLRRLISAARRIEREAQEESRPPEETASFAEKLIYEVGQTTNAQSFVSVGELMGPTIEEVVKLRGSRDLFTGLRTHFRDLDTMTNGLQRQDLIILAARPSIGKTAFALNIAMNVAVLEKVPVGIFSLEMGREQLNLRLLCSHAKIPGGRVRRGILTDAQEAKLRDAAGTLGQAPIFIDDTPGLALMQLRSRARRLKAQHPNLGFIVVDYLQLMTGDSRGGRDYNRQQEVSDISRGLKALARELNLPVMALSQLSRNIEQRSGKEKSAKPMLSDLRESGAIEQDADIVMFVHRERVEAQKDEDGQVVDKNAPVPTEIIIGKHRNGPTGKVDLMFFSDFTLFAPALKTN